METENNGLGGIRAAIVLIGCYVAAQMIADIASLKVVSIFSLPLDAGTFIYPITFTLRDLVHKRLGKPAARAVVVLAAAINLLMALYFLMVSSLPPHQSWDVALTEGLSMDGAFRLILAPAWAVVLASILAELLSELSDTEVFHAVTVALRGRHQWVAVLASNSLAIPLDSLVFCFIAGIFAWHMPLPDILWNSVLNMGVKFLVTLVSLPLIYLTRWRDSDRA